MLNLGAAIRLTTTESNPQQRLRPRDPQPKSQGKVQTAGPTASYLVLPMTP
jgi:hypothetical protein